MEESQGRQQSSYSKPMLYPTESKIDLAPVTKPPAGTLGRAIKLIANHFKVSLKNTNTIFYQYNISFASEDKRNISAKAVRCEIIDKLYETYVSDFLDPNFAYDGVHSLYTVASLPYNQMDFKVAIEESYFSTADGEIFSNDSNSSKRSKRSSRVKIYDVKISFAAKIPIKPIALALNGAKRESGAQDALRVLDTILKHHAMKMGKCLALRQSFFHEDCKSYSDIGNGVSIARGFYTSFRTSQDNLLLNIDISATLVFKPGPVIDFILNNQDVRDVRMVNWDKAKRTLKNLRIRAKHRKGEYKIIGLSEKPCNQQFFSMRERNGNSSDITVYDYFTKHLNIKIEESAFLPCLDVGKLKKPSYLPIELCSLVSLQSYRKQLPPMQAASFAAKLRQKPEEKKQTVINAIKQYPFEKYPLLAACGATIENRMVNVVGRVLDTPQIVVGNRESLNPQNGKWNFKNKELFHPKNFKKWAIVNFSARCNMSYISRELISCARKMGFDIDRPLSLLEEDPQTTRETATSRVQNMCSRLKSSIIDAPDFVLCILAEKKCSPIYGPWKRKFLCDYGIPTQCISPGKLTDQYFTNVLLKINAKVGGINSLLEIEKTPCNLSVSKIPTLIVGMDVSHGPSHSRVPSVAAVVGSRCWPYISRYSAFTRTQPPKQEMIECLFRLSSEGEDIGLMRDVLVEFFESTNGTKPKHVVIFRDGVGESQFDHVLDIEFQQILKTYDALNEVDLPKFTVVVAQKKHHTNLFKATGPENIPPGTVVDTTIVNSYNFNFYLCAHTGIIGTSRPIHYHVLLDEYGYSADALQELIHSLSYVYQRGSNATSLVAPICYAHHAAAQVAQFLPTDESSEDYGELPLLDEKVSGSMFFC